jgi:hypothetical protein
MAITLQITDGTDTVDLNDGSNLYLGAAFQMNVGEGAVTEQIISGWANGLTADQKAVISKKFNRLIRKAVLHYREQRIDRAVWLVWKPDDQTDTQYAKVMGGGEVEVVKHTIGGWGGGYFNPTIIREGAWRDTAPTGGNGTSLDSGTVYNKTDADGNNYLEISSARTNDAPNLLTFKIQSGDMGTIPDIVTIAMKRNTSALLDNYVPHFNPTDLANNGGATQEADTNAAGDVRLTITATGTPYWTIADTDLEGYFGNHAVYACTWINSGGGAATVAFATNNITGKAKSLSSSSLQNLIYLGNFNLPGTEFNPFLTLNTSEDLQLQLVYTVTSGTPTIYLYGLILVPLDIPPIAVNTAGNMASTNDLWIDGVHELSYVTDSSGDLRVSLPVTVAGRYPYSAGGEYNRFYFYFWSSENSGYFTAYTPNNNCSVNIYAVERFLGLRGNT